MPRAIAMIPTALYIQEVDSEPIPASDLKPRTINMPTAKYAAKIPPMNAKAIICQARILGVLLVVAHVVAGLQGTRQVIQDYPLGISRRGSNYDLDAVLGKKTLGTSSHATSDDHIRLLLV